MMYNDAGKLQKPIVVGMELFLSAVIEETPMLVLVFYGFDFTSDGSSLDVYMVRLLLLSEEGFNSTHDFAGVRQCVLESGS